MKTIVVGYDGTEASERALARAGDIAAAFGASVVVTSVSSLMTGASHGGGSVDPTDSPDEHDALLTEAQAKLAEKGIEAAAVLGVGDPAEAIVQLAEERNADLIVVGTHEPGFFERVLGHSVSAAVQRHARCDVLIVH
jgi:nucleotide-binding universal stress UspA family protein